MGPVTLLLVAPVAAAGALCFLPAVKERLIRLTALGGCAVSLVLAFFCFIGYDRSSAGYQFVERLPWVPALGIDYHVGLDGISLTLLLMTTLVAFCGTWTAFSVKERVKEFYILYLLLISGCLGVFCSLNLFFIYFFYELAVIPVYLLISLWGSKNRQYAAMKLTLYLTLGAVAALVGILMFYLRLGPTAFDLPTLTQTLRQSPPAQGFAVTALALITLGFGIIVTLWPFHTWSPLGYAAAPTPVSMLHAGVLKKLGAYLILRLGIGLLPGTAKETLEIVAWAAVLNILYCGLIAYRQKDLKFILGYSSCSHMGLVLLGLASCQQLALEGTIFFMFAHGLMAALGFAAVGYIYDRTHTRGIDDFGGLSKNIPFVTAVFLMAGLASSGVPGFGTFIGEFLVFLGAFSRYPIQTILGVTGLLVTAGYMFNLFRRVFQGPPNPRWQTLTDPPLAIRLPMLLLLGGLILVGLLPGLILPTIQSGIRPIAQALTGTIS
ncbi:MAG: NADH-quinone oxidoreductase subunit M [Candidatus Omnitrophota bacterium]